MVDFSIRQREVPRPYLLFLGDMKDPLDAKTACGLIEWRPHWCLGQARLSSSAVDLGLPELSFVEAVGRGARTLVLGSAPVGGRLPLNWVSALEQALRAGLNIASGLHDRLAAIPSLCALAAEHGCELIDVRDPPAGVELPVATGKRRTGRRVLTVGLDCAIGKKFTALQLERDLIARGLKARFCASGQTGILISGGGVAIDAVVADFVAGVAELLSPDNDPDHWDIIEGQGSIFHPAYSAVSLGLLHGSQPDAIVLCHEATRTHLDYFDNFPLVDIETGIDLHLRLARLTNPRVRCVGISLRTSQLPADERLAALAALEKQTGLPCVDPAVTGTGRLVDALSQIEQETR